jgi:hypothetical protein
MEQVSIECQINKPFNGKVKTLKNHIFEAQLWK